MSWKNRIVDHGEEVPDQLLANPLNWRTHPKFQQQALSAVLEEVGIVQQVIVNRRTGHLVDGHLRVTLAMRRDEPSIPVIYVDLSEEEEKKILVTFDPLSALAESDREVLTNLLNELGNGDDLLKYIAEDHGITPPDFEPLTDEQSRLDQKRAVVCPSCGTSFTP